MGVVSDMEDPQTLDINQKLRSVLYYNPYNRQTGPLVSHTHAITLDQPILTIPEIEPHNVQEVIHLMDDSRVRYIVADIYDIDDLIPYKED